MKVPPTPLPRVAGIHRYSPPDCLNGVSASPSCLLPGAGHRPHARRRESRPRGRAACTCRRCCQPLPVLRSGSAPVVRWKLCRVSWMWASWLMQRWSASIGGKRSQSRRWRIPASGKASPPRVRRCCPTSARTTQQRATGRSWRYGIANSGGRSRRCRDYFRLVGQTAQTAGVPAWPKAKWTRSRSIGLPISPSNPAATARRRSSARQ